MMINVHRWIVALIVSMGVPAWAADVVKLSSDKPVVGTYETQASQGLWR